jgi:hypothetical protein
MRKIFVVSPALLSACSTTPEAQVESGPQQPIPVHGVTTGHKCDAAGGARFVGQPGTSQTGAAIMRATHAAVLRWAPAGYMLTMDYSENRVTVRLGPDYRVTEIKCG